MPETLRQLYRRGTDVIAKGGADNAAFDARCLLEHFYGLSLPSLLLQAGSEAENAAGYIALCERRAAGEPLQYILGSWEFMGLPFSVTPDVLIPRQDTETLVEYVLEQSPAAPRVLDLCCGSGCIGLALKHFLPESDVTLADISEKALSVARKNAAALGLSVTVVQADALAGGDRCFEHNSFDFIVSNPPYIKSGMMAKLPREVLREPAVALDGGEDGMDFYRAIALQWENQLAPRGQLVFETGYDTAQGVYDLLTECGYANIACRRDLSGVLRVVAGRKGAADEET